MISGLVFTKRIKNDVIDYVNKKLKNSTVTKTTNL